MACPHVVHYGNTGSSVRRSEICWHAFIMTSVSVRPCVCLSGCMFVTPRDRKRRRGMIRKMKMS